MGQRFRDATLVACDVPVVNANLLLGRFFQWRGAGSEGWNILCCLTNHSMNCAREKRVLTVWSRYENICIPVPCERLGHCKASVSVVRG